LRNRASLTARYLNGKVRVATEGERASAAMPPGHPCVVVRGAAAHNLKGIDTRFPLRRMTAVTGVSGSGKSTLVQDVLFYAVRQAMRRPVEAPGAHRAIEGWERLSDVVLVDQSPLGKTARSNPCSYVGAFAPIRAIFADQPLARERGYKPGSFSFNSGLRCPACEGNGFERVEMQFLSDVYLRCPECDGRRYRPELLDVKALGASGESARSIADVLDMTVDDAAAFFADRRDVAAALEPLRAVGLGYLRLGQASPTLSGGEAQRLKLAAHLAAGRAEGDGILFLLDEPTTGLHFDDIRKLLGVLNRLVDQGNTVIVIEHNLDVIKTADWIIDLGPEGGPDGGCVVAQGTPEQVASTRGSHTGRFLKPALRRR
jgi:excinuclease ABC subunit A